jgi:hypothetical protein
LDGTAQLVNWNGGLTVNHKLNPVSDVNLTLYKSRETSYLTGNNSESATGNTMEGGQDAAGGVRGFQLEYVLKTSPVNTVTWGYNQETREFNIVIDQLTKVKAFLKKDTR